MSSVVLQLEADDVHVSNSEMMNEEGGVKPKAGVALTERISTRLKSAPGEMVKLAKTLPERHACLMIGSVGLGGDGGLMSVPLLYKRNYACSTQIGVPKKLV